MRKPKTPLPVGERCWRCKAIIPAGELRLARGLHDICFSCFMRPRVLVQIMERLQRQGQEVAS